MSLFPRQKYANQRESLAQCETIPTRKKESAAEGLPSESKKNVSWCDTRRRQDIFVAE